MVRPAEADEIADRINRHSVGPWLLNLLGHLGEAVPNGLAVPRERVQVEAPAHGLGLVLYRRAEPGGPHRSDALVVERARFNAALCGLPFGLDARNETSHTAGAKLSADTAGRGYRISWFLLDARVVELTFNAGSPGLKSVLVARLGSEAAWM